MENKAAYIEESNTISFEIANKAVSHLGRNLYNSTPPALAELVANSFDAYAKNVDVFHGTDQTFGTFIAVADDGLGMSLESLRDRYGKIGKGKVEDPCPPDMTKRNPMGKKGIGKLAAFSIGSSYTVFTKTSTDREWLKFSLEYDMLTTDETRYEAPFELVGPLPEFLSKYETNKSGFIVVISSLRRNWTSSTESALPTQMSRRFFIASTNHEFNVSIDNEPLDLSKHDYYDKLQLVIYFGYGDNGVSRELGKSETRFDEPFDPSRLSDDDRDVYGLMVESKHVRGWLGFVERPKDLHAGNKANFATVAVYIDGKIADEDLLKDSPDSTYAGRYMVGEVFADYLQDLPEDVVTSSRQGLSIDNAEVGLLFKLVKAIRTNAIARWNDLKTKKAIETLPDYILQDQAYQVWVESLDNKSSNLNRKLVRAIVDVADDIGDNGASSEVTVKSLINGTIEMVELSKQVDLSNTIDELNKSGYYDKAFASLIALLAKINASEAVGLKHVADKRLQALGKLRELMNSDAKEVEFQRLLGDNPWIINPSWRPLLDEDPTFCAQREAFHRLRDENGDMNKTFIDLLISVRDITQEHFVIVEMKREKAGGYARVTVMDIYNQIDKYRRAMNQCHSELDPSKTIPAVFILSSNTGREGTGHAITLTDEQISMLETATIQVIPYDKLLTDSERSLADTIGAKSQAGERPFFTI